nr:MAG TPA: hypothetical protein [Caudoviricetes sp.]
MFSILVFHWTYNTRLQNPLLYIKWQNCKSR